MWASVSRCSHEDPASSIVSVAVSASVRLGQDCWQWVAEAGPGATNNTMPPRLLQGKIEGLANSQNGMGRNIGI